MGQRTFDFDERGRSYDDLFALYDAAHPDIYRLFVRFAREARARGRTRFSGKAIMERIRWETPAGAEDDDFKVKVNDKFTSRYVRKFLGEHPDFAGFLATRELKTT